MRSLRTRLIVGTVVATIVIDAVAAGVLYASIRRSLLAEFDAVLEARARALAALTEEGSRGISLDHEAAQFAGIGDANADAGYALLADAGTVIARSARPAAGDWWASLPRTRLPAFEFLTLADRRQLRCVVLRFAPKPEDEERPIDPNRRRMVTLVLARDATPMLARLGRLAWLLAGVFGLTALAAAAIMAWVVGRNVRPLRLLAQRLAQLREDDLGRPVVLADVPDEVRPVVDRLNDLLARLQRSFARERAFTADIAHELRTPLAGLTTAMEICASQRRDPAEYERTILRCLAVARAMRGMVENLLTLARADANQLTPAPRPVDLAELLREAWRPHEARAAARGLTIDWRMADGTAARGDLALLRTVFANLLDNAVSYAAAPGTIEVSVALDAAAHVRIVNDGSAVAAEDAERVFDRFWRGDTARSSSGEHCGLGLPLCRRIVLLLGGTIHVQTTQGGRFVVTVNLPSDQPDPVPSHDAPEGLA